MMRGVRALFIRKSRGCLAIRTDAKKLAATLLDVLDR
jgi:hypothetical protein